MMNGESIAQKLMSHGRLALEPGLPMMLQTDEAAEQFRCYFVGLQEEQCLVLRLPLNVGVGWQLGDGSKITAKFLHNGTVFGFHSEIVGKYFKAPLRFLFIAIPQDVEKVEIRKHFRVTCMVPATVIAGEASLQGLVSDVGLGGMKFVHHPHGQTRPEIKAEDAVILRCLMLGMTGVQEISCQVRNVTQDHSEYVLGLGFENLAPDLLEAIRGYINRVVSLIEDVEI